MGRIPVGLMGMNSRASLFFFAPQQGTLTAERRWDLSRLISTPSLQPEARSFKTEAQSFKTEEGPRR